MKLPPVFVLTWECCSGRGLPGPAGSPRRPPGCRRWGCRWGTGNLHLRSTRRQASPPEQPRCVELIKKIIITQQIFDYLTSPAWSQTIGSAPTFIQADRSNGAELGGNLPVWFRRAWTQTHSEVRDKKSKTKVTPRGRNSLLTAASCSSWSSSSVPLVWK